MSFTLAILREQKLPPERRAPHTPGQVAELLARYPGSRVWVQPCQHRCFADVLYAEAGADLREDVAGADYLFGIKERKPDTLLADAHYVIFSHTIKRQPHNAGLLGAMLAHACTLTDYECITDEGGARLVAFGYFAGVVGALHGLRMWGRRTGRYTMHPPHRYQNVAEALADVPATALQGLRAVVTGRGRVSMGAAGVFAQAGLAQLQPDAYLCTAQDDAPAFTILGSEQLYAPMDGAWRGTAHFYANPEAYRSAFSPYLAASDLLLTGAFWEEGYPRLFAQGELAVPTTRLRLIADVSCDIDGAVLCTQRPTTIADPYLDFDMATCHEEAPFSSPDHVTLMAVDNLPCEMPAEASAHFGRQILDNFLDNLLSSGPIAHRARIVDGGHLTPRFAYLEDYGSVVLG